MTIQLRPDAAPSHVERIRTLTRQGFYNGLMFHRVIEGFMAQGGDPTGSGMGGSQLPNLNAEISGLPHVRGAVGMARAQDLNSANSQFFIMFTPRLQMDREYTVFGRVVGGMNFVDAIERGEPAPAPSPPGRPRASSARAPPSPCGAPRRGLRSRRTRGPAGARRHRTRCRERCRRRRRCRSHPRSSGGASERDTWGTPRTAPATRAGCPWSEAAGRRSRRPLGAR